VTRDPAITKELGELARQHRRARQRSAAFVSQLGACYPQPRARAEWSAYCLLRRTWTRPQVKSFVAAYATGNILFPGVLDTHPGGMNLNEFMACVGILAEGEYARTLPRKAMLALLCGADAVRGATVIEAASYGGAMSAAMRSTSMRDEERAAEFRRRRSHSGLSDTALKEVIGKEYRLGRTAAIDAIDRGLKKSSG
jgi:hypothetical protein